MWQNPYPWPRVRVFVRIEILVPVPVPVTKTRGKPAGTAVPVHFTSFVLPALQIWSAVYLYRTVVLFCMWWLMVSR
jgi:hypothetical protein